MLGFTVLGSSVLDVSILSPPVPQLLGIAAFGALGAAIATPTKRWWTHALPILILGSAGALAAASYVVDLERRVHSTFPHSFYVWAWLPLFALAVTAASWGRTRVWQRAVRVTSVVLLTAFAGTLVNLHYGYLPDVRALLGQPEPEQIPRGELGSRGLARRKQGALVELDVPATRSRFHHRPAMVWLPPAWFHGHVALPVIVLLSGTPGRPEDLVRAGAVDAVAERYASLHRGRAPIIVLPDDNGSFFGDTECVNGPLGHAETYLTVDVPTFVHKRFGATIDPDQWAIGGISEGGTCALVLALRHPDVYRHVLDISGDPYPNVGVGPNGETRATQHLYGGDASQWAAHNPISLMESHPFPGDSAWFAAGAQDSSHLRAAHMLAAAAKRACITTIFTSSPGGHSFMYFKVALRDALPWLADQVSRSAAGVRNPACARGVSADLASRS